MSAPGATRAERSPPSPAPPAPRMRKLAAASSASTWNEPPATRTFTWCALAASSRTSQSGALPNRSGASPEKSLRATAAYGLRWGSRMERTLSARRSCSAWTQPASAMVSPYAPRPRAAQPRRPLEVTAAVLLVGVAARFQLLQLPILRLLVLAVVLPALAWRQRGLLALVQRSGARPLALLDRMPRAHPAHERVLRIARRVERRGLALRLAAGEPQLAVRLQPLRPGAAMPLADDRAFVDAHQVFLACAPRLDAELRAAHAGDRVLGLHLEPLAREKLVHLGPEVPQGEPGAEGAAPWRGFAQLHAGAFADAH